MLALPRVQLNYVSAAGLIGQHTAIRALARKIAFCMMQIQTSARPTVCANVYTRTFYCRGLEFIYAVAQRAILIRLIAYMLLLGRCLFMDGNSIASREHRCEVAER